MLAGETAELIIVAKDVAGAASPWVATSLPSPGSAPAMLSPPRQVQLVLGLGIRCSRACHSTNSCLMYPTCW